MFSDENLRVISWAPKYSISAYGIVVKTVSKDILPHFNRHGYYYVHLPCVEYDLKKPIRKNINGKMETITKGYCSKLIAAHRLVAEFWVNNPDPAKNITVNHIDGNTANNHYTNLEWVTHEENINHALYNGLRTDNINCRIRNFYTGEIIDCISLAEAKRKMGLPTNVLTSRLNPVRFGVLLNGEWEFRFADDNRPWFYENRKEKVSSRYLVTVIDPDGNKVEYFDIDKFILTFNKLPSRKTLQTMPELVDRARVEYPNYNFDIIDAQQIDRYGDSRARLRTNYGKVWLYDIFENKTSIFNTVHDLSMSINMAQKTIRSYFKHDKPIKGRYIISRLNDTTRINRYIRLFNITDYTATPS